ncbi:unnamed protein product [Rotaria sp. Silwood2]|nr:unnamed protein product [Rotaria sp. Silwood2]
MPKRDDLLVEQLWNEAIINYGIKQTRQLLSNECHPTVLKLDIDCRQRHLSNLISIHSRYVHWMEFNEIRLEAEIVVSQLSRIIEDINEETNAQIKKCKSDYRNSISTPNDDDDNNVGSLYIRLCERLLLEITNLEFRRMFPGMHAKMIEWMHEPGSEDKFQPKVVDLTTTIQHDLTDPWSNSHL